jgi:hypothetical protein
VPDENQLYRRHADQIVREYEIDPDLAYELVEQANGVLRTAQIAARRHVTRQVAFEAGVRSRLTIGTEAKLATMHLTENVQEVASEIRTAQTIGGTQAEPGTHVLLHQAGGPATLVRIDTIMLVEDLDLDDDGVLDRLAV